MSQESPTRLNARRGNFRKSAVVMNSRKTDGFVDTVRSQKSLDSTEDVSQVMLWNLSDVQIKYANDTAKQFNLKS